jgi:hypothetical protein
MKYTIELNEKQIRMLAQVLEQHSRIICGHISTHTIPSIDYVLHKRYKDKFDEYIKMRNLLDEKLFEVKQLMFDGEDMANMRHGNYGIHYSEESDLAYEMYKQILYTFEREDYEKCIKNGEKYSGNVHSGTPIKLTDEPCIKVNYKSDRELKLERILKEENGKN